MFLRYRTLIRGVNLEHHPGDKIITSFWYSEIYKHRGRARILVGFSAICAYHH